MVMDLKQLRYFQEIGTRGSFTAAAQALNISQPALTYHLKQLEAALGVTVLERHPRGIKFTKAGERLFNHLQYVFEQLAKIDEIVTPFRTGEPMTVRLGVTPTAGRIIGPLLVASLGDQTRFQIVLYEKLTREIMTAFGVKDIDAALAYETPDSLAFQSVPLYSEDLFLVGPPDLVDPSDGPVDFSGIGDFPLLMDRRLNVIRELIERVAADRELRLNYAFEIEPNSIKRELITKHRHCTIAPYGFMQEELESGAVRARKLKNPALTCTVVLLFRDGLPDEIRHFLHQRIASLVAAKIEVADMRWRHPVADRRRRSSSVALLDESNPSPRASGFDRVASSRKPPSSSIDA